MPARRSSWLIFLFVVAACKPDTTEVAALSQDVPPAGLSLADVGWQIHELEVRAAAELYGDSSGQTEGAEEMRHTLFESSVRVLQGAARRDSTNAQTWFLLARALQDRAYRGEGEWNIPDQRAAVQAFERALSLSAADTQLRTRVDSALADNRETLRRLLEP